MNLAHQLQKSTATPVPDFATPAKPTLGSLINALNAAVATTEHWAPIEEDLERSFKEGAPPRPKVLGGKASAIKLVLEGKPGAEWPATDWFYQSREEIEKDLSRELSKAETSADRAAIETRFADLLADFDRQEKACRRTVPKKLREARRKVSEAHDAWSDAEQAIVQYEPTSLDDAVALLEFAGRTGMRDVYFMVDDGDLKTMMQNAAAAIKRAS